MCQIEISPYSARSFVMLNTNPTPQIGKSVKLNRSPYSARSFVMRPPYSECRFVML